MSDDTPGTSGAPQGWAGPNASPFPTSGHSPAPAGGGPTGPPPPHEPAPPRTGPPGPPPGAPAYPGSAANGHPQAPSYPPYGGPSPQRAAGPSYPQVQPGRFPAGYGPQGQPQPGPHAYPQEGGRAPAQGTPYPNGVRPGYPQGPGAGYPPAQGQPYAHGARPGPAQGPGPGYPGYPQQPYGAHPVPGGVQQARHLPSDDPGASGSRWKQLPGALRRKPAALIAGGVAVALVATLGVAGLGSFGPGGGVNPGTQAADLGEAEFASFDSMVSPTKEFVFEVGYDLSTMQFDGRMAYPTDAYEVYLDPQLTVPAPDAYVNDMTDGYIKIKPGFQPVTATDMSDEIVDLAPGGKWGLSSRYFIAQRLDATTGERLAEPIVTAFTVDTGVDTTSVSFEVDGDGVGNFSWDPVADAKNYYFVEVEVLPGPPMTISVPRIIGETSKTSWSTIEQDENVQEGLEDTGEYAMGVTSMNYDFRTYRWSEDDTHDAYLDTTDNQTSTIMYGVIAVTDEGNSSLSVVTDEVASQLPNSEAYNALDEMGLDVTTAADLPATRPVTMADGRTVMLPITYDPESIHDADVIHGNTDDDGNIIGNTWHTTEWVVYYSVEGTLFTGYYSLEAADKATAQAEVRTAMERVRAETAKAGGTSGFTYTSKANGYDGQKASKTAPEVAYPVNGTNPLTTYLAANIIAGEEYIDVSAYLPKGSTVTTSGVDLYDAVFEAISQNPFALGFVELGYASRDQVLVVRYTSYESLEDRKAEQESLAAEIDRVAGQIFTADMNEEAKARAINAYLISTAEYDYDALDAHEAGNEEEFSHAWDATGVLVDKRGVCASYAKAFKALADKAGVQSMYVSGIVNETGGRHAWNKVKLGDTWRMVDSTWNDSNPADEFLFLTDEQTAQTRVEGTDWVLDSRVSDYAAH